MIIDKPAGASMLLLMLRPRLRYVLLCRASTPDPVIERKSRIQQSKSGQTSRTAELFSMAQIQKGQTQFGSEPTREDTESSVHHEKRFLALVPLAGPLSAFCLTFSKKKVSGFAFFHQNSCLFDPRFVRPMGFVQRLYPQSMEDGSRRPLLDPSCKRFKTDVLRG